MVQHSNVKKGLRPLLIGLICATVLFIWINSMLPPEKSSAQSGAVQEFIEEVVPDEFDLKEFLIANVRKIGHFLEFGLLGIFVALYLFLFLFHKRAVFIPTSIAFAFGIAFLDETIQVLSGRGPLLMDVWLDAFGYTVFWTLTLGGCLLYKLCANLIKKKRSELTGEDS